MSWHILSLTLRAALRAHPPPTEIQSLDSDMQNLVHENYNKFISATDTIRKMKHNVEDMESELHNLIKNMDAMQECSHAVNERLSDQYSKVRAVCGRREGGEEGQCKRTACGRDVIDVVIGSASRHFPYSYQDTQLLPLACYCLSRLTPILPP